MKTFDGISLAVRQINGLYLRHVAMISYNDIKN
jgi:hypothetical protein